MVNSGRAKLEASTLDELIVKLTEIHSGLRQNLADLHQKLEVMDSEPGLLNSIEVLKKDAESHASRLEIEVKQLHEEINAIKEILGFKFETNNPVNS